MTGTSILEASVDKSKMLFNLVIKIQHTPQSVSDHIHIAKVYSTNQVGLTRQTQNVLTNTCYDHLQRMTHYWEEG